MLRNRTENEGKSIMNFHPERYQLRKAAGLYWLIDMEQPGVPYRKPVPLNETGAQICEMVMENMNQEMIAKKLSETYGISYDEALEDVNVFLQRLSQQDINI